jgi:hypothetical protein
MAVTGQGDVPEGHVALTFPSVAVLRRERRGKVSLLCNDIVSRKE